MFPARGSPLAAVFVASLLRCSNPHFRIQLRGTDCPRLRGYRFAEMICYFHLRPLDRPREHGLRPPSRNDAFQWVGGGSGGCWPALVSRGLLPPWGWIPDGTLCSVSGRVDGGAFGPACLVWRTGPGPLDVCAPAAVFLRDIPRRRCVALAAAGVLDRVVPAVGTLLPAKVRAAWRGGVAAPGLDGFGIFS